MKNKNSWDLILIFMGIVFLLAALYRIFNYNIGILEFEQLKIPILFLPVTILLEFILGILFIINKKVKYASITAIIFLSIAVIIAFIFNFNEILKNINEIFIFRPTPTDVLLHIVYIILLFLIYKKYSKKKN